MQITKEYNGKSVTVSGNLGDLQAFESLDAETQDKIVRLFGHSPFDMVEKGPAMYTENDMIEAYLAGAQDIIDQIDVPDYVGDYDAKNYIKSLGKN
jgi:hypothetical protein